MESSAPERLVWTIGHWNHPQEVFLARLASERIETVADVRSLPGSRRSPWFGAEQMPSWLGEAGVGYRHLPALGGRRRRQSPEDPAANAGWQHPSFRNFADYTLTPEFELGLRELEQLAQTARTAIMCGEPVPWRCHRSLIANVLVTRGWTVRHILPERVITHELGRWGPAPRLTPAGIVTYPSAEREQPADDHSGL